MNGAVVVDASLVVKLLVREIQLDLVLKLTRIWLRHGTRVVAPYLMFVEVANAYSKSPAKDTSRSLLPRAW